jgi:hypothetical protein
LAWSLHSKPPKKWDILQHFLLLSLAKKWGQIVTSPLWRNVRMTLTLPKWGLGSPPGLSESQNSIAGVQKPRLDVFFISLERSWSVDVENGLAWAIRTSAAQVMCEKGPGIKLAIWLLTTKSQESTRFPCVQATCDIPLESSRRGLKLCLRPHRDWRSAQEVMCPQSRKSLNCCNFETPSWES